MCSCYIDPHLTTRFTRISRRTQGRNYNRGGHSPVFLKAKRKLCDLREILVNLVVN